LKYPIAGFGTANSNADQFISDRVNFIGSNFYGQVQSPNPIDRVSNYGMLPYNFITILENENPDYIVYSYATPIAWHGTHGWNIPAIKYSVSTSKHQNYIRRALS